MSTHFRNDLGHLAVNPLSPNIHIQILQTGLYITLKNKLGEFGRRFKHFLLGDHFINSHNYFSWY